MLRRILVVDDDRNVRRSLAIGLRLGGFDVSEADGASSAHELLETAPAPDLALIDLMLPEVSGLEIARWIQTRGLGTTIVLMSGYHLSDRQVERANAGVAAFLPKPFRIEDVVQVCTELLESVGRRAAG